MLNNITLLKKAQFLALLLVVFVAAVVTMTLRSTQSIEGVNTEVTARGIPLLNGAQELRLHIVQIQQFLQDISATRGQDGLNDGFAKAEKHYLAAKQNLKDLTALDEANGNAYADLGARLETYYAVGKRMAKAYVDLGPAGGNAMMDKFDAAADAMTGQVGALLTRVSDNSSAMLAQTSASARVAGRAIVILALVGGGVMLGGLWLLIVALRPLHALTHTTLRIAENDLTGRVPQTGSKDEIGQLATAIDALQGKLTRRIQEIANVSHQVNAAVETMNAVVEHTSMGVRKQHSETEQVATAMNEMTATVHEVARNTAAAANAASQADQEVGNGSQVVKQTITSIGKLADEVRKGADAIGRLETDSNNIGAVLDVIKGIAEQTNLLALNAAIEAARAGEQGRGFAVVADEVRTLAQRTQASTREIQQMIEKLQQGAREAVQVMNDGRSQAEASVTQAGQAGRSLDSIHAAVSTIRDMSTQIASAVEEQGAVAEEINRNIVNISQVVEQTAEGAAQTSSAGEELSHLAEQLQTVVARFKLA
ncbi:MAG: methyl-accepting chemotaxis protein [Gammaproteobacteria bacterium]|nr:methyl-accepting chemotaxis protein [Gammaproteobacteria bacterium]